MLFSLALRSGTAVSQRLTGIYIYSVFHTIYKENYKRLMNSFACTSKKDRDLQCWVRTGFAFLAVGPLVPLSNIWRRCRFDAFQLSSVCLRRWSRCAAMAVAPLHISVLYLTSSMFFFLHSATNESTCHQNFNIEKNLSNLTFSNLEKVIKKLKKLKKS